MSNFTESRGKKTPLDFWLRQQVSAAASTTYLDRVTINVDVPVNGVTLKSDAYVKVYSDYLEQYYWKDKSPFTYSVTWYEKGSRTPLTRDTVAELGKSYNVTVTISPKAGYAFRSDLSNYTTTINGVEVTPQSYVSGAYWCFSTTYTTIPAVSGNISAYYSALNIAPYEGNPVEVSVTVTNATNPKYQWYIVHGAVLRQEVFLIRAL